MKRQTAVVAIFASILLLWMAECASAAAAAAEEPRNDASEEGGLLECVTEDDLVGCLRKRLARDIDRMEIQVAGGARRTNEPPMSRVIEETGNFVAEFIGDLKEEDEEELQEREGEDDSQEIEEARRKKYGKKKKKHLQKLIALAMLFKAKLSLLLQLITTHLQVKFFVIAVISLLLNATKFWLDVKKNPSKVIYYEHAQHQHHYDHDDEAHGGYWGRSSSSSSNESPHDLAYNAYAPAN